MKNKKLWALVEKVLAKYPASRDSDRELFWCVAEEVAGRALDGISKADLFRLPNYETLGRFRRKLQEAGLYQASAEAAQARLKAEEEMRDMARKPTDALRGSQSPSAASGEPAGKPEKPAGEQMKLI